MKKPRQVRVAAWAWPATTPAMIHGADARIVPFEPRRCRGDVAATTLAPVGVVASDG